MNAYELQALRHVFGMTVTECADWIAPDDGVTAWHEWESGEREIPANVVEQMQEMRRKRKIHRNALIKKINDRIGNNTMRFFPDLVTFQTVYSDGNFLDWKIYQSVAAELYADDLEHLC